MNKKSIAHIRNQFKDDNELMKIKDLFHVYVKKETGEIYHEYSQSFQMVETEQQEMFMKNFKKVLTGKLDSKLFELKFNRGDRSAGDGTQEILYSALNADAVDWKMAMLEVVSKMFDGFGYTMDTVVTFIRGEYSKPTQRRSQDSEEGGNDEVSVNKFILCSVNKTDQPKKALIFDYKEKEFKSNNVLDPIINLTSPLVGFMFPAFNDNSPDVNHVLYSAGDVNYPDTHFIENVLNCNGIVTAQRDKASFERILRKVIGDKVDTTTISNVYERINHIMAEDEDGTAKLDATDIEDILQASGVEDVKNVALAFQDVFESDNGELKASSLIPNYNSKSIKITTKIADISISPKELRNLHQVTHRGKKCILIEVDEYAIVEGFELAVEKL
jgi:hypothetical protein